MSKGLEVQRTRCNPEMERSSVGWGVDPGEVGEAIRAQVRGALVAPGRTLALQLAKGNWEPWEVLSRG